MSYILDALKKSEAERSRGVVPTLLTPPQTPFRPSMANWMLLGALIMNVGLFAVWMTWPHATKETAPLTEAPLPASATENSNGAVAPMARAGASPDNVASEERSAQNAEVPFRSEQPNLASDSSSTTAPIVATESSEVSSSDGPPTPDVSFSTHVYATDPSMRAVTINGRRFIEGDTIKPGVRIEEITETGVVLDVGGRSIPVDVLQDWH